MDGAESVKADLENASLPVITVEHIDGAPRVLGRCEKNSTIATRPVIGSERDVGAKDRSGAPEKILEVLPTYAVRKLDCQNRADDPRMTEV